MRRQCMLTITLALVLVGAGCATGPPAYNPFKVSQDEIYGKVKTIVLAPVIVPVNLADPEPVKVKFESILEAKLREAGFSVVPSKEGAGIWKQMTEQVGGFFDPVSGKRDDAKYRTVREHTFRELRARFQVDAVLHPAIVPVRAQWEGLTASWDGTEESITSFGDAFKEALPYALFGISVTRHGAVGALSLVVSIEDVNGVDMYVNAGGIQLLAKISGGNFVGVPRHELFANEERNVAAVNIALGPLVSKSTPSEAVEKEP